MVCAVTRQEVSCIDIQSNFKKKHKSRLLQPDFTYATLRCDDCLYRTCLTSNRPSSACSSLVQLTFASQPWGAVGRLLILLISVAPSLALRLLACPLALYASFMLLQNQQD